MNRSWVTPWIFGAMLALSACSTDGNDARGKDGVSPGEDDVVAEAPSGEPDTSYVDPALVWVDPAARLQWQRDAAPERMALDVATTYCEENQAGLPGLGWHVPSITELRSLVRGCPGSEPDGACGVTEECLSFADCWTRDCWTCTLGEGPADGCYRDAGLEGDCGATWAFDIVGDIGGRAWFVNFQNGGVHHDLVTNPSQVRCVRWY